MTDPTDPTQRFGALPVAERRPLSATPARGLRARDRAWLRAGAGAGALAFAVGLVVGAATAGSGEPARSRGPVAEATPPPGTVTPTSSPGTVTTV